jgi:hypothetical protein
VLSNVEFRSKFRRLEHDEDVSAAADSKGHSDDGDRRNVAPQQVKVKEPLIKKDGFTASFQLSVAGNSLRIGSSNVRIVVNVAPSKDSVAPNSSQDSTQSMQLLDCYGSDSS